MTSFWAEPGSLMVVLFFVSMLPFLFVMGTCFLKISIVFNLLRNAIGTQQVPPNMALYGLSLILTAFIMAPIGMQVAKNLESQPLNLDSPWAVTQFNEEVLEPYRDFLKRFASKEQVVFFSEIPLQSWPEYYREPLNPDSLLVLLPAFAVTQLIEGFKIGFLLYLPFIAIDLIVSNVLLAMGMMMVSPLTIALPFKLLVFVLIGGWEQLIEQLVVSYASLPA